MHVGHLWIRSVTFSFIQKTLSLSNIKLFEKRIEIGIRIEVGALLKYGIRGITFRAKALSLY